MATMTSPGFLRRIDSPIGRIELVSDGTAVTSLTIERGGALPFDEEPERSNPVLEQAASQLAEYFAGGRQEFDVPVTTRGTQFQRDVWQVLAQLPYGTSISYGELGRATGRATAGRAIGGAVGANPVPIIVPCHRVLASNGRITGYSGGEGIPTKAWLLQHEGVGLNRRGTASPALASQQRDALPQAPARPETLGGPKGDAEVGTR
jgi:methylated-DNA-[protein]-cysteine S-methyltransferase